MDARKNNQPNPIQMTLIDISIVLATGWFCWWYFNENILIFGSWKDGKTSKDIKDTIK